MTLPRAIVIPAVLLALTVLSYQNCSLYKSEGRKFLDTNGNEILANTGSSTSGDPGTKPVPNVNCSPYLYIEKDSELLGSSAVDLQFTEDAANDEKTCLILVPDESHIKAIKCSISKENLEYVFAVDAADRMKGPIQDTSDQESFGFTTSSTEGVVSLNFVATKASTTHAVHCIMEFSDETRYQQSMPKALQRVSSLVHEISIHL